MGRAWVKWSIGLAAPVLVLAGLRIAAALLSPAPPGRVVPPPRSHGADAFGDPLPEHALARIGTVRWRGDAAAVWAPDGKHLLVGGGDQDIYALDVETGRVDWTLPGHSEAFVHPVEWDDLPRILHRGEVTRNHDILSGLTILPDGRLLSQGYTHRIWNLETRKLEGLVVMRGGTTSPAAASPDGRYAAFPWMQSVRIVDHRAGVELRPSIDVPGDAASVVWLPAGDRLAVGMDEGRVAFVGADGSGIRIHDVSEGSIHGLAVARGGSELWTADDVGGIAILDLENLDGASVVIPPDSEDGSAKGHAAITVSPDGRTVGVSQGRLPIRWFDVRTRARVEGPTSEPGAYPVGWSPDGRRFALWSQRHGIRIVGEGVPEPPDVSATNISHIAWSPDGRSVAVADGWPDGAVRVADPESGAVRWIARFDRPCTGLAWSRDGTTLVVAPLERVVWLDASSGAVQRTWVTPGAAGIEGQVSWWNRVRLDRHGEVAYWADDGGRLRFAALRDPPSELAVSEFGHRSIGHGTPRGFVLPGGAPSVVLALNGESRVTTSDGKGQVQRHVEVWEPGATQPLRTVIVADLDVFAVSVDGRFLATGELTCGVLDLAAEPPHEVASFVAEERDRVFGPYGFSAAAFSPDGERLALADAFNEIHVYRVADGAELKTLRGHRAAVHCMEFSADGTRLATGSEDTTVLIWDVGE